MSEIRRRRELQDPEMARMMAGPAAASAPQAAGPAGRMAAPASVMANTAMS